MFSENGFWSSKAKCTVKILAVAEAEDSLCVVSTGKEKDNFKKERGVLTLKARSKRLLR